MAKDNDLSYGNKSLSPNESDSNKSFVKKVTSRVSGFIPSTLSKWFSNSESAVRPRDDSDEEESLQIQPPAKRVKTNDSTIADFQRNNLQHTASINSKIISQRPSASDFNSSVIFPEPIAGPSGISCRKQLGSSKAALNAHLHTPKQTDIKNCDKSSDSGESTSGYSSMRVGSKELVTENGEQTKVNSVVASPEKSKSVLFNTTTKLNRSLFNDRSSTPQLNSSLSARQPSFNSTVFGSPNFVDRTLSSKRILDSPFYSGRTTYGGASAYARRLGRTSPGSSTLPRNSVQIKPVNEKRTGDNAALSKTARRILDTLEQYTTPIADVKKIPNPPKRAAKYTHINPYSVRDVKVPSNKELQVPTVPDLLKMKLKNKMQNTTVSVRQIATTSKSTLNKEDYHIAENEKERGKHTNKIKDKLFSFHGPTVHETAEQVKLPDIQLPITSLPVFNFTLPTPASITMASSSTETISSPFHHHFETTTVKTTEKTVSVSSTEKSVELKKTEQVVKETVRRDSNRTEQNKTERNQTKISKQTEYAFSNPVVISENRKHVKAINNFIFSEPILSKDMKPVSSTLPKNNGKKCGAVKEPLPKPTTNGSVKFPTQENKTTPITSSVKFPTQENKTTPITSSVKFPMQENRTIPITSSFGDKFKPPADTWECSACMIRNLNNVTKCDACNAPKPGPVVNKQANGFGEQFKKKDNQWECDSCMVRNSSDNTTCLCCNAPKPGSTKNSSSVKFPPPEIKVSSSFGDSFKPSADTWECSVCMIRNKNDATSCIACNCSKQAVAAKQNNGFGEQFKKKDDQWECDSCMIRNSSENLKCLCCDAPKPGATKNLNIPKETKAISTFNFGVVNNADMQFSFGLKPTENKPVTCTPAIFGKPAGSSAPATFSFGINPPASKSDTPTKVDAPAAFSFGIKATPSNTEHTTSIKKPDVTATETKEVSSATEAATSATKSTLNGEVKEIPKLFESTPKSDKNALSKTPAFSFGTKPVEPAAPPTSDSKSLPVFGASKSTGSLFKTTVATNTTTAIATPTFGTTKLFGGPSTAPSSVLSQVIPASFGSKRSAEGDEAPPAKAPMFSFGQADKKVEEQPKINFGKPSGGSGGTFTFGQSGSSSQATSGGFNFGATPLNPPVSTPQNGTFQFGGTPAKPAFNFGGSSQPQAAGQGQGLFSFGSAAASSAPSGQTSGGFNFGSEIKPPFNFTTGAPPSNFSAPSSNAGPDRQRVIKRALRRTTQR